MHALVQLMTSSAMSPYTGLIAAAQNDPKLASELYGRLVGPRVADCAARIAKAQADGQVRAGIDPETIVELLYAPLYYRLLLHFREVTEEQVDTTLDLVFSGIGAASTL